MATNPFFNNYTNNQNEKDLFEGLTIEMIKMYGFDAYYLPRTVNAKDELYHEDRLSSYDSAHELEFYLKSVDNFEGDGDFFSNLGLEIRDQMVLACAIKRWKEEVGEVLDRLRPYEDDLLYLPFTKRFYRISFVDHEDVFYQNGSLRTYMLRCELIEYSGQRIQTGIAELDTYFESVDTTEATTIEELADKDPFAKNEVLQDLADEVMNFDVLDPFAENGRF